MGIQKPASNGIGVFIHPAAVGVPAVSSTNTPDMITMSGPAQCCEHIMAPSAH